MTMIHLAPGTLLNGGKYRIERFISSGGFGCTYEGKHTMLGKRVAIKEFFVKDFCNRNETSGSVEIGTRSKEVLVGKLKKKFIEEACVLSQYEHPNIVHVSDVFEENGTAYYVMDYIDGESLHEKVKRHGHLDEKQALDYILQVADALEYVHDHNRLHLDVKPGNIMVAPGNRAVLIDFGISKHYDDVSGENTSTMLGVNTPGYAPHEQITQSLKTFSPATDIYALGATFYKLLTGVTPPNSVALMGDEETLSPLPSAISATVRNAVERAMAIKRKDRPQTIAEFRRLLGEKQQSQNKEKEDVREKTDLDDSNRHHNQKKEERIYKEEPITYDVGRNKNILKFVVVAVVLLLVGGLVGYRVTSDSDSEGYPIAEDGYFEPAEIVSDTIVVYDDSLAVYEEPEKVVSEVDNKSTTSGMSCVVNGSSGIYSGDLLNGVPHGSGTFVYDDGRKYVGEFENGKYHGNGTFTWTNGDKYVGKYKDGKKHGQGTYTWGENSTWTRDKYVGEWKDDSRTGQGTYYYSNGDKYVGEYKDGKKSGQGTFTWKDGDKYVGEYKDDVRSGQGTFYNADGTIWRKGLWENGEFVE